MLITYCNALYIYIFLHYLVKLLEINIYVHRMSFRLDALLSRLPGARMSYLLQRLLPPLLQQCSEVRPERCSAGRAPDTGRRKLPGLRQVSPFHVVSGESLPRALG